MKHFLLLIATLSLFVISVFAYNIGDIVTNPDGSKGVVYWLHPNRSGGWMVALNDMPTRLQWGDSIDVPTMIHTNWVEDYSDTLGYSNTNNIRQFYPVNPSYAAHAIDFENGWYLPTATQLAVLNIYLSTIRPILLANGGSDIQLDNYWSSSQADTLTAIAFDFYYVGYPNLNKTDSCLVRAIRSFTNESFLYDTTLTYLWNTGDTLPNIKVEPITTTLYNVTVTNSYGCTAYKEQTIFVGQNQTDSIVASICQGEKYTENGFNDSITGIYTRVETLDNGCAFTLKLNLTVNPVKDTIIKDTTCVNQEYNNHGFYFSAIDSVGDYTQNQVYLTSHGCDSTVVLQLHVLPAIKTIIQDSICQGESYDKYGFYLPEQRILGWHNFQRTINSLSSPCDSTIELQLKVSPASFSVTNTTICKGESFNFNGVDYTNEGIYAAYLTNAAGCDSIATLRIIVNDTTSSITNDTICQGSTYVFNGISYTTAGTYSKVFPNATGCDSVATLKLIVNQPSSSLTKVSICLDETYIFNGITYSTTGIYVDTLTNAVGCDSVATLELEVSNPEDTYIYKTITSQEDFYFNGQKLTETGIYIDTLKSYINCDSIIILNLTVIKVIEVPEVFSPNGDGVNDLFIIKYIDQYPQNKVLIFNRWGNKVWEKGPYLNDWDGTNQFGITVAGRDLPVGTYFYIIDLGDGSKPKKGFIYLNR